MVALLHAQAAIVVDCMLTHILLDKAESLALVADLSSEGECTDFILALPWKCDSCSAIQTCTLLHVSKH